MEQSLAWLVGGVAHELTLFAAIGMLLGGLDDLLLDACWLGRAGWRRHAVYSRHARTTMASLPVPDAPGRLAVFIPAWREAEVIGGMLRAALARLDHPDYRLYVGTYPNDPATARAVRAVGDPRIRLVGGDRPGPTSKAECLNRLWRAMRADERRSGVRVKAIVLHDAEDVVHPQELRLYDRMIERFDLVQIPVFPLPAHGSGWQARLVAAIYCDEFAEAHGRQLTMREALGAAVPSAGVGCAIRCEMLARMSTASGNGPFDEGSLTEDYELGLRIAAHGGRGAFVTIPAQPGALPVAVRAHFPESFETAIRQKSRWVTGIALAGWDRLRWRGGLAERWMRFRDRKAALAAVVLSAGYAALLIDLICWPFGAGRPVSRMLLLLLGANGALLAWRLVMRAAVVAQIYGRAAGCWSMPRMLAANYIAIRAVADAMLAYVPGRPARWNKTSHVFPGLLPCD